MLDATLKCAATAFTCIPQHTYRNWTLLRRKPRMSPHDRNWFSIWRVRLKGVFFSRLQKWLNDKTGCITWSDLLTAIVMSGKLARENGVSKGKTFYTIHQMLNVKPDDNLDIFVKLIYLVCIILHNVFYKCIIKVVWRECLNNVTSLLSAVKLLVVFILHVCLFNLQQCRFSVLLLVY